VLVPPDDAHEIADVIGITKEVFTVSHRVRP
jgi:hypothetical protein